MIEEAPLQGEMMLFNPVTGQFFVMNRTMAVAWKRCDGSTSAAGIAAEIVETFAEVDRPHAEADVASALEELLKLGLVVDSAQTIP